jgi:haloalkane dehalogenase
MVQTSHALRFRLLAIALAASFGAACSPSGTATSTIESSAVASISAASSTSVPTSTATTELEPVQTSTTTARVPVAVTFPTKAGTVSVAKLSNPGTSGVPSGASPFSVPFRGQSIHGIDIAGPGPAVLLLHGFPDNLHLYDELFPKLTGKRRVIAIDFIGWGASDKPLPGAFDYSMATHEAEIAAVLDALKPGPVELVLHDASGIPGIDFALHQPDRVSRLILLNTFYGLSPTQSPPYAINMYAAPGLQAVEHAVNLDPAALEGLYRYQLNLFLSTNPNGASVVDRLWSLFPEALPAFTALNDTLFTEVRQRTIDFDQIGGLTMPVNIMFGANDTNLTTGVAEDLARRIPGATLAIVANASHFVQIDAPEEVAALILGK